MSEESPGEAEEQVVGNDVQIDDDEGWGGEDDDDEQLAEEDELTYSHQEMEELRTKLLAMTDRKVRKYKERSLQLRHMLTNTLEQNAALKKMVDEYHQEKLENETQRFLNSGSVMNAGHAMMEMEHKKNTQMRRRQILEGIEALEQADDMIEGDDGDVSGAKDTAGAFDRRGWKIGQSDIKMIASRYGTGVAVFFEALQFMLINSLVFTVLWAGVYTYQAIHYEESLSEFQFILPTWTYFSRYSISPQFYILALFLCGVFITWVSLRRWISAHRNHIRSEIGLDSQDAMAVLYSALINEKEHAKASDLNDQQMIVSQLVDDTNESDISYLKALRRLRKKQMSKESDAAESRSGPLGLEIMHTHSSSSDQHKLDENSLGYQMAYLAFNCWDYSLNGYEEAEGHLGFLAGRFRLLLHEMKTLESIQQRSTKQWCVIYCRRILGVLTNTVVVFGGWAAIVLITVEQETIREWLSDNFSQIENVAEFVPPLCTTIINIILPFITVSLTKFERWDSMSITIKQQLWRLYIGMQANLLIQLVTYYTIAKTQEFTLLDLKGNFDATTYTCGVDAAAAGLFMLMITEFAVSKLIPIGGFLLRSMFLCCCGKQCILCRHPQYGVSGSLIKSIYFQALVWISMPLYPPGAVVASVCWYINFKFELLKLVGLYTKPKTTIDGKYTGESFSMLYNVALVSVYGVWCVFLYTSWECIDATSGLPVGLFRNTEDHVPWKEGKQFFDDHNIEYIYDILTSPVLYATLCLVILMWVGFRGNWIKIAKELMNKVTAKHRRHVLTLQADIDRKTKLLEAQRRANKIDEFG